MEKMENCDSGSETLIEKAENASACDSELPLYIQLRNKKLAAWEILRGCEERGENENGWALLPDIVIEKIFAHLSIRDRYSASIVCRQWHRAFYMQRTWHTFELEDTTLTRRKFNYYYGWQHTLDHLRTQLFIHRVGKFIRRLILSTMWNLFNLYQFMNMISFHAEKHMEDSGENNSCVFKINTLRFVFWCESANVESGQHVYGTGGQLLEGLKRLMRNLKDLWNLELIDLLLDSAEAQNLLDDVCMILCEQLKSLTLINTTKAQCMLLHPACFVNLRVLKISPQSLGDEMIEMLSNHCTLEELHIIQNVYSENGVSLSSKSWAKVGHRFRVYLRTVGKTDKELIWQEKAPVCSILYDCPRTKVSLQSVLTVIELYSSTLQEYGHFGLPKFSGSRKFKNRVDTILLGLCRQCPYLNTLFVRERISTSTALLIVGMSPNLRYFYVRKNALILKCDYDFHKLNLDYNFSQWIKLNARSYERTNREIGKIMNCDWKPLIDCEFKLICNQRIAY